VLQLFNHKDIQPQHEFILQCKKFCPLALLTFADVYGFAHLIISPATAAA